MYGGSQVIGVLNPFYFFDCMITLPVPLFFLDLSKAQCLCLAMRQPSLPSSTEVSQQVRKLPWDVFDAAEIDARIVQLGSYVVQQKLQVKFVGIGGGIHRVMFMPHKTDSGFPLARRFALGGHWPCS
jgi:hypothetical protein